MNYSIIAYIIGWILNFEALFMALPCITAIFYHEHSGWAFFLSAMFCLLIGIPLVQKKTKNKIFYTREGCVTVALSWFILSIMGALPFLIGGVISNPIDAVFETVSGFTTTGASILLDVESLTKCMLMWRSFTHWIGGMGVLVFILCLLPLTGGDGGYHVNLMKAESPGPSVSKLVPQVQSTAKILYSIYLTLTVIEFVLLLFGKMSVFDALTTSFGTAGTGGFGIKNDSIAGYSPYIQYVVTIFMILFGINFSAYFLLLSKKLRQAIHMEEVRWYLIIIFASIVFISFNARAMFSTLEETIRHVSFQVASVITTTGFATTDFDLWPEFSRTILVILMFIGACAGSTGGGIKVSRFILLIKTMKKELHTYLHPRSVRKIQMDGKVVEHNVLRSTNVYMIAYILIFVASVLLISLDNFDLTTNFTAVSATLNNIGPGLELVGPTQNFSLFSNGSKLILIFDMLAGRLELFPLLLLFVRDSWRRF